MNIKISNQGDKPIYEQISNSIKESIFSGEFLEGDSLPSMRLLAKDLRVSVITTKRAYEKLEKEGFIYSITGKGSFIKPINKEIIREEMLISIQNCMQESVELARKASIDLSELMDILKIIYEEGE